MTHETDTSVDSAQVENKLIRHTIAAEAMQLPGAKIASLDTTGVTKMFAQKSVYVAEALTVALNAGLAAFSHSKLAPINGIIAVGLLILAIAFNRKRIHSRGFRFLF